MRKEKIFVLILVVSIILLLTSIAHADFWGSSQSNKYHYPSCKWAQKIKPTNLVKFKTPEDAIKAGYQPCKICKPPVRSVTSVDEFYSLQPISHQTGDEEYRRGCCSHHRGVCGCKNGKIVCCDKTYSKTCRCKK